MAEAGARGRGAGSNRAAILEAAYVAIAELGYRGATTAEVCRRAGVSSGTFFHYFPTKERLLMELLAEPDGGGAEAESPAGSAAHGDPRPTAGPSPASRVAGILDGVIEECADPHLPAFAREVATLTAIPGVAEALQRSADARRRGLGAALEADRRAGLARTDLPVAELVRRLELLIDGFEAGVASGESSAPRFAERAASLRGAAADVVRAPASGGGRD